MYRLTGDIRTSMLTTIIVYKLKILYNNSSLEYANLTNNIGDKNNMNEDTRPC